jgi:hypothetical protein
LKDDLGGRHWRSHAGWRVLWPFEARSVGGGYGFGARGRLGGRKDRGNRAVFKDLSLHDAWDVHI